MALKKQPDIEAQFNRIAETYDADRRKFIPCFDAFYNETTELLAAGLTPPKQVLDLGAGTGLLTAYWHEKFPAAAFTLVDLAADMLNVARQRFAACRNFDYLCRDYLVSFPEASFDAVISALSIHHLTDPDKEVLFEKVYDHLPSGGIFVNYDQFCVQSRKVNRWIEASWRSGLYDGRLTEVQLKAWEERSRLDIECTVDQGKVMLRRAGFKDVECIFTNGKFSVIVAVKA